MRNTYIVKYCKDGQEIIVTYSTPRNRDYAEAHIYMLENRGDKCTVEFNNNVVYETGKGWTE